MLYKFPNHYNIQPYSWILPDQFEEFKQNYSNNENKLYIMKPTAASCGRRIQIISEMDYIEIKEKSIISIYIDRPLLINDKKFDMRIYVLVSSFYPLRIYFYKDGLARFATEEYSYNIEEAQLQNKFVHLTNYSINKKNI